MFQQAFRRFPQRPLTAVRTTNSAPCQFLIFRNHSILSGGSRTETRKLSSVQATPQARGEQQQQQVVDSWELNLQGIDEAWLQGKRSDDWFTGVHPRELASKGQLKSLAQPILDTLTDVEVKEYFDNTWTLTEVLFSSLQGEEPFYRPPYHHLRHPMIFYFGHPACFYVNKLQVAGVIDSGINPYFEEIFEVGVDEMRWDDMSKNAMHWPAVSEVHEYRKQVYQLVSSVIDEHLDASNPKHVNWDHPLWSLFMGFEHERIHLETSSVLLRELPLNLLRKPEFWPALHPSASTSSSAKRRNPTRGTDYPVNELVKVAGQKNVLIGKEEEFPSYGWDNEYGFRSVDVEDFEASKMMVSNGEFYEFVADGGYREREYWTEDGWGWRSFRNAKWPFFWEQAGPAGKHEYKLRTIFEVVEMPWSWPVNVNKHEATAFCNWKAKKRNQKGLRLVTEAEHMLLREPQQRHPVKDTTADPALTFGGEEISEKANVNLNLAFGSESPVDYFKPNAQGFHDVIGNAWEWAEDDFNALENFMVHPYYDDFSSPCFDGEHNMILGGSFISSGDAGANLHCRYHFRPHFLQHSGFRYVQPSRKETFPGQGVATKLGGPSDSNDTTKSGGDDNVYETRELVNQYVALHFGQSPEVVNQTVRAHAERPDATLNFPKRCADLVVEMAHKYGARVGPAARALDLGCAVGGSTFELAKHYGEVVGIDFSHAFVDKAKEIRDAKDPIEFSVPVEGTIVREGITVSLDRSIDYSGVHFQQGDACNLKAPEVYGGQFDAVLMANLLCRLPDPIKCLGDLGNLVNPGGLVVTVSPFSWLETFTPKDAWLQHGSKSSSDVLRDVMHGFGFDQVFVRDIPLMIREHERKYQYIISHGAVFRKRSN